jgi:hypothetical protein
MVSKLFGSRKAVMMMLALAGVVLLASLGRITGDQALDFLKVTLPAWLAAQAWEDGKVKAAAIGRGEAAPRP